MKLITCPKDDCGKEGVAVSNTGTIERHWPPAADSKNPGEACALSEEKFKDLRVHDENR